jgi:hypothetical protein
MLFSKSASVMWPIQKVADGSRLISDAGAEMGTSLQLLRRLL